MFCLFVFYIYEDTDVLRCFSYLLLKGKLILPRIQCIIFVLVLKPHEREKNKNMLAILQNSTILFIYLACMEAKYLFLSFMAVNATITFQFMICGWSFCFSGVWNLSGIEYVNTVRSRGFWEAWADPFKCTDIMETLSDNEY